MKRSIVILILTAVALMGFAVAAHAEVEKSASADASFMSNYVWRGQKLSEDWVIQPSVTLGYGGFGMNLWANYDGDTTEHNETDLTLSYAFDVTEKVGLEVGYIYYALDGAADTQELYVSAGADVMLQPSLTFYYDVEEGNGGFLVAAIGHSFPLSDDISLDLGASASINFDNKVMGAGEDGSEFTGLYNGEISAAVSIPVTEDISITPMIAYSFPLSDDSEFAIESISFDADGDIVYGGVNVSVSF